jgi:hypothetical protein
MPGWVIHPRCPLDGRRRGLAFGRYLCLKPILLVVAKTAYSVFDGLGCWRHA